MTLDEMALALAVELIRKSGVREWDEDQSTMRANLAAAAREMAVDLYFGDLELMVTKILITEMDGTPKQICFADHATDFNPTAANDLRKTTDASQETDVQLDLTSLADSAYRQSTKVDLGADRAATYMVRAAFELAATPTAGDVISLYWAPSWSATAGTGNPGGASGADAAYDGYSANGDSAVNQLVHIGDFICTVQATATVQVAEVGMFTPTERYGSLIVRNESGAAFHTDAVESHVVFDPVIDEFQNA